VDYVVVVNWYVMILLL